VSQQFVGDGIETGARLIAVRQVAQQIGREESLFEPDVLKRVEEVVVLLAPAGINLS
jgi:hypothetical protein